MGGRLDRYFIPAVVGFAPVVLFLLTWNVPSHRFAPLLMREYSVTEVAAELIAIVVALREGMIASWKRMTLQRLDWIALGALALLIIVAIATVALVAPDQARGIVRTTYWIIHLLFGFSIAFVCGRLFRAGDLVSGYMAGFAAFALAFAVFAITSLHRPIDWTWDLPAVSHIRHIGIYATPIIALCIGRMAARNGRALALAFALAFAGIALSLWTGSRGPVAALAVAVAVGLMFAAGRRPVAWGGAALALALAYAFVFLLPAPASNMGAARTITATTQSGDVGTGRMTLWTIVIHAIERRPLFGYGEGQMPTVTPFFGMGQPHNLILQLLLAWGAVGLLCAAVLALWFLCRAVPAVRESQGALLGPFLAMIALVALSMVDASMYHVLPLSIFAACGGMIVAGSGRKSAAT